MSGAPPRFNMRRTTAGAHGMTVVDWIARTTMLVLAALATLALIGSLASVSNSPIGDAFPGQITASKTTESEEIAAAGPAASRTAELPGPFAEQTMVATVARAAADREGDVARWLKALTYAVIALAAVAAAGVVALVRIGGHIARLADR